MESPRLPYAFSDGSPVYEVAAFWAVFALSALVVSVPPVRRVIAASLARLAGFLVRRGLFRVDDVDAEQRRLDLVRIVVGILATWRMLLELGVAPAQDSALVVPLQYLALALSMMLALGLATPLVAALYMVLLNLVFDNLATASNLGSQVQAMILLVLVFAPAGRTRSLDALLLRRGDRVGATWRRLYAPWGRLTPERAAILRWCALVSYAAVAFHSGLLHALDQDWASGLLSAWVLLSDTTNPRFHELADALYRASPFLFVNLSRVATYSLLAWLLLLLPLILWGGVPRAIAIGYGLAFFAQAAFVVPLQMLGWFEYLLWALLFWDGRLLPLPTWVRRPIAAAAGRWRAVDGWPSPGPGRLAAPPAAGGAAPALTRGADRLYHASALSLVVLLAAFLVRLPTVKDLPAVVPLAEASHELVGQAPLTYGIGPLSVLNSRDLRMLRISFEMYWTEGDTPISDGYPTTLGTTDSEVYAMTAYLRSMALSGEICGEELVNGLLATRYGRDGQPVGLGDDVYFHTQFFMTDWPTEADLAAYRYVPVVRRPTCIVSLDADTLEVARIQYFDASAEVLERRYDLPFDVNPDGVPLLGRFPCDEEKARIGTWFDTTWYAAKYPAAGPLVSRLMEDKYGYNPSACFADVERVLASFPLDRDPLRATDPGTVCTPDLTLADAYYDRVFDGPLRAWTLGLVNRATIAHARGDEVTCLLAAIDVRRAYLRSLGAPPPDSDLGLPAVSAPTPPFRVRPDTIPLLEQFPCRSEVVRMRWWGERLGAAPNGRAATDVLARLAQPAIFDDPIECFAEVEAARRELGLDWHAGSLPPARASCDVDLPLARAYGKIPGIGQVGGRVREAEAAAATGDHVACILASSDVRRAYLATLDESYATDGQIADATRDAGLPFPVFAESARLVERFPCRAEAERIAWWYDRPNVVRRGGGAPAALDRLWQVASQDDPTTCLAAVLRFSTSMDLSWRHGYQPPARTTCAQDLDLAATYYNAVFNDRLRAETQGLIEQAVAARVRGEDATCMLASAAIRRVYLGAIGAPASIYELAADPFTTVAGQRRD